MPNFSVERCTKKIPPKSDHDLPFPTKHLVNRALETTGYGEDDDRTRFFNWLDLDKHDLGKRLRLALEKPVQASGAEHESSDAAAQGRYASPTLISVERGTPAIWPTMLQLGEVAELCWSILGPAKTCAVLKLEDWNLRLPMAAHHYLAMLVREGLVAEILETNYDDFVEEAVLETFGSERRKYESAPGKKRRVDAAPVM